MSRTSHMTMRPDPKIQAIVCTDCGAWPALVRPRLHVAYCEKCIKRKE